MLVNLRIFHFPHEFLRPNHHSTFEARIGNVGNYRLGDKCLFELYQLFVLTKLVLGYYPVVVTIHCMASHRRTLHLAQSYLSRVVFGQGVESIAGHCVFDVLKLDWA